MTTYTTNSSISLEEQRIAAALAQIKEWKDACNCRGGFCEQFGTTLDELAAILSDTPERLTEQTEIHPNEPRYPQ